MAGCRTLRFSGCGFSPPMLLRSSLLSVLRAHYFFTSLLHHFFPCYNHLMPKNSLLVLGLMSGTSADGIEAALARISGAPPKLKSKLEGHASLPIPKPIRSKILQIAEGTPRPRNQSTQFPPRPTLRRSRHGHLQKTPRPSKIPRSDRLPRPDHLPSRPTSPVPRRQNLFHS